jgi:hypothetical protein
MGDFMLHSRRGEWLQDFVAKPFDLFLLMERIALAGPRSAFASRSPLP